MSREYTERELEEMKQKCYDVFVSKGFKGEVSEEHGDVINYFIVRGFFSGDFAEYLKKEILTIVREEMYDLLEKRDKGEI